MSHPAYCVYINKYFLLLKYLVLKLKFHSLTKSTFDKRQNDSAYFTPYSLSSEPLFNEGLHLMRAFDNNGNLKTTSSSSSLSQPIGTTSHWWAQTFSRYDRVKTTYYYTRNDKPEAPITQLFDLNQVVAPSCWRLTSLLSKIISYLNVK